jgi:ketosteroid isomerase-like protein
MSTVTQQGFEEWLRGYKRAWESRNAEAAASLFSPDARYYWTPFDPPQSGRPEIAAAWQNAVSQQKDVTFTYAVLATEGNRGIAQWRTRLTSVPKGESVELDGILIAEFADAKLCREFREWWHVRGTPS